jgi:hypothetical protein
MFRCVLPWQPTRGLLAKKCKQHSKTNNHNKKITRSNKHNAHCCSIEIHEMQHSSARRLLRCGCHTELVWEWHQL